MWAKPTTQGTWSLVRVSVSNPRPRFARTAHKQRLQKNGEGLTALSVSLLEQEDLVDLNVRSPSPVNALSPGVPEGISEALDQIAKDASVKAVVWY
jgi:hypothetical protein